MLSAMLLLVFAAGAPKVEPDKEEMKKFQGKWIVTEHEHGGKKTPMKELANLTLEVLSKSAQRVAVMRARDSAASACTSSARAPLNCCSNSGASMSASNSPAFTGAPMSTYHFLRKPLARA